MKLRILMLAVVAMIASFAAFAADTNSPPAGTVQYSVVPYECLTNGTFDKGGWAYTCRKVDDAFVWHARSGNEFKKGIFEANRKKVAETVENMGMVVEQLEQKTFTETVRKAEEFKAVAKVVQGTKKQTTESTQWKYK